MERSQTPRKRAAQAREGVKIAGVALLRAVNVGGAGKLLMRDLAAIFVQFGCTSVETYIQSGNVVFVAPEEAIAALPGLVSAALRRKFGVDAPVIIRRGSEWRRVIEENPFLERNVNRSPPDEFVLRDKEIYLRLPNGVARSKLANSYFERMLGASATMRNWRTVLMLDEMTRAKG